MSEPRDPAIGDPVLLHGRIISLNAGTALVELYRSDPVGVRVPVQVGALDLAESTDEGGAVPG